MVYGPVDAAASRELARKVRSLEAQIAVLRRGAAHIALSEQLAGIKGAIKQLEPCLIDNFGEDRMAILEQLAALQKSVEDMQEVVDAQAGQLSTLNNTVQSISASAEKAGWIRGRLPIKNWNSSNGTYWTGTTNRIGNGTKGRFSLDDTDTWYDPGITVQEATFRFSLRCPNSVTWPSGIQLDIGANAGLPSQFSSSLSLGVISIDHTTPSTIYDSYSKWIKVPLSDSLITTLRNPLNYVIYWGYSGNNSASDYLTFSFNNEYKYYHPETYQLRQTPHIDYWYTWN